jgi:phosphatidylethanolamine/phosphatidyl-N-methylethanolamine N-methyltransferase
MKTIVDLSTRYYEQYFDQNANKGFNGYLFKFTHKKLELIPRMIDGQRRKASLKVLEVGAGAGQHFKFVEKTYAKYVMTDINSSLLPKNTKASRLQNIEYKIADVQNLPFKQGSFDRVISTCLLHHLNDVEKALSEIKRVTKSGGGLVSIYLSCDPGILNRVLRKLLIIPKAKKLGFNEYEVFIAREHRNHFQSIKVMIEEVFKGHLIQIRYYPFKIRSWNLNTFCIFQIQIVTDSQ